MSVAAQIRSAREYASSVDGSLLDDTTWNSRHRWILGITWASIVCELAFTLVDPKHPGGQWLIVAVAALLAAAAGGGRFSRRAREVTVTLALACAELYTSSYVGNLMPGALSVILITFYQDWLPIALGCFYVTVVAALAWVDPSLYHGSVALAAEVPHTGMSLRAVTILLAAPLALAIWRAGTQTGRDLLTGMLSHAGAEQALDRAIARGQHPAVWVCDIDNFRAVNQHLGAETGDRVLKRVADRLRQLAREQDGSWFCARLGGDTFLIASRHAADDGFVSSFAHRLEDETGLAAVGASLDDLPVRLTIGAAGAVAGEDGAGLLRAAERNMLRAKGRGSLRVVVEESPDRVVEHASPLLSAELHGACERGELELYLQPIVRLADGLPVGAETLVRWHHPERGLILPGEFLPEAEQDSGLMAVVGGYLGAQFLEIAGDFILRRGRNWLSYGYTYNLAAIRLRDPLLPQLIGGNLVASGLQSTGGALHLEVTEGALMDLEHGAPAALATLRAGGYRIALDDFGTGHSSLAHLRDFPLDTVKIDRAFVQSMDRSPIDRAVVQAVADIASVTGLDVVAEGVETEGQRLTLLEISPEILAQGWLYAKAMPADEFEVWVDGRKRAAVA
jgi:diguanylate cyclase (GGDEF)-like protein